MTSALGHYGETIQKLRHRGKQWNLSDEEIDRIIDESFKFLETDLQSRGKCHTEKKKKVWMFIGLIAIVAVTFLTIFPYRKTVHSIIERNIQEIIYPSMKFLRKFMLPIVKSFPSLTEWYDEACLVSNPYFKVSDIDCWPCENVRSILNLTLSNLSNDEFHSGIPFIVKDSSIRKVDFKMLRNVYYSKKSVFDKDAPRVDHSHGYLTTAQELFDNNFLRQGQSPEKNVHITWKLNRLEPTREMRFLFGMPSRIPNYIAGATPEKYILIDEPKSSHYYLPPTEGTTVFVIQGTGARLFVLEPSRECTNSCHRVSVLLKPNHVLWYNWWYWRAISLPVENSSKLSITYVGSYY